MAPLPPAVLKALDETPTEQLVAAYSAVMGGELPTGPCVSILQVSEDHRMTAIVFKSRHECEVYAAGLMMAADTIFGPDDDGKPDTDG